MQGGHNKQKMTSTYYNKSQKLSCEVALTTLQLV